MPSVSLALEKWEKPYNDNTYHDQMTIWKNLSLTLSLTLNRNWNKPCWYVSSWWVATYCSHILAKWYYFLSFELSRIISTPATYKKKSKSKPSEKRTNVILVVDNLYKTESFHVDALALLVGSERVNVKLVWIFQRCHTPGSLWFTHCMHRQSYNTNIASESIIVILATITQSKLLRHCELN